MAEDTLVQSKLDQLSGSFEEHEETVIGHGRHEELSQMLMELQTEHMNSSTSSIERIAAGYRVSHRTIL